MKINIPQVTFTRFIASISIVFFHFAANYSPFDRPVMHYFISHANVGVSYFFILSGFILTVVYDPEFFSKKGSLKKFFVARFARIYPVYFLALLLAVVSIFLYARDLFSFPTAISNALLLQGWIPSHVKLYNTPGWSLSAEAFFYLIFPWLIYKVFRNSFSLSAVTALTVWLLSFAAMLFILHLPESNINENIRLFRVVNPLLLVNNFLIGIAGGIAFREDRFPAIRKYSLAFLLGSIAVILCLFFIPNAAIEKAENGLLAPLFIVFILSLAYHKGVITRILSNRIFLFFGDISYSIYILQVPLSSWYGGMVLKLGIVLSPISFIYIYILFLILFSAVCYTGFEKPLRKYLRNLG